MVSVEDAQEQSDLLERLIDSLATAADPNTVRPQIKEEALSLHSMELSLVNPAVLEAQAAAASQLDALISWETCFDASVRPKVIGAAKSCEPIVGLQARVMGWTHCLGTLNWTQTPEVPAAALPNYLATYRSITGT